MHRPRPLPAVPAPFLAAFSALVLAGLLGPISASGQSKARFDFPQERDHLLIEYGMHHDELAENDPTPWVRIYGDGTVLVHRPQYVRRAGSFRMQLDDVALDGLVATMVDLGVVELEADRLDESIRRADAARESKDGTRVHISDHSWSRFQIHLSLWDPQGTGLDTGPRSHEIRFADVEWQAGRWPGIPSLQGLAAVERSLRDLWSAPELVKDESAEESNQ